MIMPIASVINLYLAVGSNRSSGTLATTWASTTANRAVGQVNSYG